MLPGMELMSCPDLAVPREVMHHVVRVESSYNPYAIGVVGGRLVRQPRNLPEALSTVRMLEQRGYNFSIGLAQVNRYNLAKYGLETYEEAFQPCANLQAGSRILRECYSRSGGDWGKSFSCYYSGDFRTGFRHGYVQKVYASMRRDSDAIGVSVAPIAVIDRVRRRVALQREPARGASAFATAAGLVERRAGLQQAQTAAASDMVAFAQQYSLPDQPSRSAPVQMPAAAGAANAVPPSQSIAAAIPAAEPTRDRPVAVTATRLGAATPPPQGRPDQGGSDGAFVF